MDKHEIKTWKEKVKFIRTETISLEAKIDDALAINRRLADTIAEEREIHRLQVQALGAQLAELQSQCPPPRSDSASILPPHPSCVVLASARKPALGRRSKYGLTSNTLTGKSCLRGECINSGHARVRLPAIGRTVFRRV